MNKILIVSALALALAGCQSTGPNQTIGTGVGAVGGYGVARALGAGSAGSAFGAVAGALIGSEVGRNIDNQPHYITPPPRVIVQPQPVYIERHPVRRNCFSVWDNIRGRYVERIVCR